MTPANPPGDANERDDGTVIVPVAFTAPAIGETAFRRADLIVEGVPHESSSYEVRIFLNNPDASADTPRTQEAGYAGDFNIFGHGGCFGATGHCDIEGAPTATEAAAVAVAMPHPLTLRTKTVTVTETLKAVLRRDGKLETVTFVPIRMAPRRSDCGPAAGLFSYKKIRLESYR